MYLWVSIAMRLSHVVFILYACTHSGVIYVYVKWIINSDEKKLNCFWCLNRKPLCRKEEFSSRFCFDLWKNVLIHFLMSLYVSNESWVRLKRKKMTCWVSKREFVWWQGMERFYWLNDKDIFICGLKLLLSHLLPTLKIHPHSTSFANLLHNLWLIKSRKH